MASPAGKQFQLLVYGATGFTGRLVAEYLARNAPSGLRWGIAGRDGAKLSALAADLRKINGGAEIGVVVGAGETIGAVASATEAVVTTAGPFLQHGEPLVRACVEHGTHYADITGETLFASEMMRKYEAEAKAKGTILVSMSGFDSVPADLTAFFLVKHAHNALAAPVKAVTGVMFGSGSVSGGTVASGLGMMKHPKRGEASYPLYLCPPTAAATVVKEGDGPRLLMRVRELGGLFTAPFVMAAINTRIVRRSAALYAMQATAGVDRTIAAAGMTPAPGAPSRAYAAAGSKFSYTEYMGLKSRFSALLMTISLGLFALVARFPALLAFATRFVRLPQPGEGPSAARRAKSWFHYYLVGTTDEAVPRKVVARMMGRDGGYDETAKMLAEAGLALALDRARLPGVGFGGGFLTPATAFGDVLLARLQTKGLRFEILAPEAFPAALRDRPEGFPGSPAAAAGGADAAAKDKAF